MPNFICITCGTQFAATEQPPIHCPICQDERQYVNHAGQQWTTLADLRADHHNVVKPEGELMGIGTEPTFAIGQRALLVRTPHGNILWDCISVIDAATIDALNKLGGIKAIAISHPHYYSSMIEWSRAFDAPVYLHAADRQWVMRPDPAIHFWDGDTHQLNPSLTLIRTGGHFDGGTVLHWADGADGKGALLAGDLIYVVPDRRYISFMFSYPNLIPLPASKVEQIVQAVAPFAFDRIYGAWFGKVIEHDAKAAVRRSAARYVQAISE
jgi:glyoxylase-like metal-dependent hydrolase (beta-lactamase superfamily II)